MSKQGHSSARRNRERKMYGRMGTKARQDLSASDWAENVRHNIEDGKKKHRKVLEQHEKQRDEELERRVALIEERGEKEGKPKEEVEREVDLFKERYDASRKGMGVSS